MNKKKTIIAISAALFSLAIGIGIPALAADTTTQHMKSQNTLIFESDEGAIAIYGDDIQLLADKITVPSHIWNPDSYAHSHEWEYINVNNETHTKHCAECGSQNDAIINHKATSSGNHEISYDGKKYDGLCYTCECGYQWTREITHNFIYTKIDETQHSVSCALNDSSYCLGFDSYKDAHIFSEPVSTDITHHVSHCTLCGGEVTEECVFEDAKDDISMTLYCKCGNSTLAIPDPEPVDPAEETEDIINDQPEASTPITPEIQTDPEPETISNNSLPETILSSNQ